MDNNLDNKSIEKNVIKEAIKAGIKEINEDNKKEMKKSWLTQRISEIGEQSLLYPKVNAKTHPYTKEVILIAGTQGYKQEPIRKICGVSQSQVSLWERGINQATIEQLAPLIAKLSPKVPGNTFHHKTVVKKTYQELPSEWEKNMLLNAYSAMRNAEPVLSFVNKAIEFNSFQIEGGQYDKTNFDSSVYKEISINQDYKPNDRHSYRNIKRRITTELKNIENFSINYENFEKSLLGSIKVSQQVAMSELESGFKEKIEKRKLFIEEVIRVKDASESESNRNDEAVLENNEQRESYLLEHSELNDLPKQKLNNFLNKEFPLPVQNDKCSKLLNDMLQESIQMYNLKPSTSFSELLNAIELSILEIKHQLSEASGTLENSHRKELLEKTILNKYKKSAEKKVIAFNNDTKNHDCLLISELASELYSETKHKLTIPIIREVIGYVQDYNYEDKEFVRSESEDVCIDLLMANAFIDYCKTLSIKTDVEDIQICGEILFSIEGSKPEVLDDDNENTDNSINRKDFFECFQLFNQGLLLAHSYEFENKTLTYIYQVDNADELLSETQKCMNRHNWDKSYQNTCLKSMEIKLLESGYRLASIRSIY